MPPTATTAVNQPHGYVMGHSPAELSRLERQGAALRDITLRFLRDHGVGPGMRVLDLGCGTGDVSMVAAELVGPAGEVIGVDRSAAALEAARDRARSRSAINVHFVEADITRLSMEAIGGRPFDAAIGRLVLLHLADPVATLRKLRPLMAPESMVAFIDLVLFDPLPAMERPLMRQSIRYIQQALTAAGAGWDPGLRMPGYFRAAGLADIQLRVDGIPIDGPDLPRLTWLAETVRTLLPVVEKLGLATAAEVDVDTLPARLAAEAEQAPGTMLGIAAVGAAARWPRND